MNDLESTLRQLASLPSQWYRTARVLPSSFGGFFLGSGNSQSDPKAVVKTST